MKTHIATDAPPAPVSATPSAAVVEPSATTGLGYWANLLEAGDHAMRSLIVEPPADREQRIALFRRNVAIINLESSSACNRVCTYCPDSIHDRKTQNLIGTSAWERFLDNVRVLRYERQVSLNLYNEPLLDPTLGRKLRELKSASPLLSTKISSNGDLMNARSLSELAEAGLDWAYVTLHVAAGKPYVDEVQLDAYRKFFKRCGVRDEPEIRIEAGRRMEARLEISGVRIVLMSTNWGMIGNDRSGVVTSLSAHQPRERPCMRVFREFTISHLGDVLPCCQFFPDVPASRAAALGRMDESDVWDVYANRLAVQWRRDMFGFSNKASPCDRCRDPDNADPASAGLRLQLLES